MIQVSTPTAKHTYHVLQLVREQWDLLWTCFKRHWFVKADNIIYYRQSGAKTSIFSDLGGNPYLNFMISAAVEIPAYAIILMILNKFGRKIPLCVFMTIAGTRG